MDEKLAYRVPEAAKLLDISRAQAYLLVARGQLPAIRLGGRSIRIPADALRRWVQEKTEGGQ